MKTGTKDNDNDIVTIVTNLLEEEVHKSRITISGKNANKSVASSAPTPFPITPTLFNHSHNNNINHMPHKKYFDEGSDDDDSYVSDISSDDADDNHNGGGSNDVNHDHNLKIDQVIMEFDKTSESSSQSIAKPKAVNYSTAGSELLAVTKSVSPNHRVEGGTTTNSHLASAFKDKRIFYIENSPTPVDPPLHSNLTTPQVGGDGSSQRTSSSDVGDPHQALKRQDSLFSNYSFRSENGKANRNRLVSSVLNPNGLPPPEEHFSSEDEYTSTDISEMDDDDDDDDGDDDDDEFDDTVEDIKFKRRVIEDVEDESEASINNTNNNYSNTINNHLNNINKFLPSRKNSQRSEANSNYEDDSSEWLSITASEDSHHEDQAPPLVFQKINPEKSSSTLNYMAEIDEKEEEGVEVALYDREDTSSPNSPKAKRKPKSLLSGLFLNEMAQTNGGASAFKYPPKKNDGKPILKRSSTTGIITIEQNPKNDTKVKRSSIIFTKKHMSLSDISRNYPHYANELVENTLLLDNPPPSSNSLKPSSILEKEGSAQSRTTQNNQNLMEDPNELLIRKQKSVVGLSDFKVTITNSHTNGMLSSSLSRYSPSSRVSTSYDDTHGNNNDSNGGGGATTTTTNESSNGNIKSMLSKSSRSLSGLFNVSKMKLSLTPLNRPEQNVLNDNVVTLASKREEPFAVDSHEKSPNVVNVSTPPKVILPHSPQVHSLLSSKDTTQSNADQPLGVHSTTAPRLSPGTLRKAMIQSELSSLLKESIIKDYKLGKVPKPDRVVPNIGPELVRAISDNNEEEDDDYHSKGW
ncbi:uncharacterized protein KQ657_004757 [Scheffersomyces spartinae]|uniref:Uncharacterized protein n=1 Tax=Scheffersomyces spartinae TaxID=45513 RepID=A0A9P7VAZ7_9ASCO|nr:uncharacterized protein KQ657_004757 [Scheffersomyces spartinae]KAG7194542.1 hypothetical protein KQ657_004757 [Scheffersomyces spartinae]